ncbi:GNAT family N-acetyltransferase [Candidatus Woesearchaeota archaeon]|nr:GNAT family N-acetyltransferase [Candidatus Woesearchaeota archaeon]
MKKENIIIKKAEKEDIGNLIKLWQGMRQYHEKIATEKDAFYDQIEKNKNTIWKKFIKKSIKDKNSLILIAYDKGKPVAYCILLIKQNIPVFKIKKYGYISDIYVEKNYRGKGMGKKLMDISVGFFKKNRIKFMELSVKHNNKSSIKFYQKYGLKEYHKHMRIKI